MSVPPAASLMNLTIRLKGPSPTVCFLATRVLWMPSDKLVAHTHNMPVPIALNRPVTMLAPPCGASLIAMQHRKRSSIWSWGAVVLVTPVFLFVLQTGLKMS